MVCMVHTLQCKTSSINVPYTQTWNVQMHAVEIKSNVKCTREFQTRIQFRFTSSVNVRLLTQSTSIGGLELSSRPEVS